MKIKITKIPNGAEPEEIRRAWVGVVIPINNTPSKQCRYSSDKNILVIEDEMTVYKVGYQEALEALKQYERLEAYDYFGQAWERFYRPQGFVFYEDVCEMVD